MALLFFLSVGLSSTSSTVGVLDLEHTLTSHLSNKRILVMLKKIKVTCTKCGKCDEQPFVALKRICKECGSPMHTVWDGILGAIIFISIAIVFFAVYFALPPSVREWLDQFSRY